MIAMQDSVLTFESSKNGWKKTYESLKGTHPQCIAFDPSNTNRVYCGTFGNGLWKTDDGGQTWDSIVGKDSRSSSGSSNSGGIIPSNNVMSVSVSHRERGIKNRFNTVYVGTEPTALYRSDDGGESWQRMDALNDLKSSTSWSFPPRPWTSHIRWIEPDKTNAGYVYVAIEAGALIQSHDGGRSWIDRVDGGPYDTHTLATHENMPGMLYSAAGDGYFESYDYGQSWNRHTTAAVFRHHGYLYGLAVDAGDPQTIIVSASQWPRQAHFLEAAESVIYRRTTLSSVKENIDGDGDDDDVNRQDWKLVTNGLPKPTGTLISILAANPKIAGEFYAVNNRGIFCSTDSGNSWKTLEDSNNSIQWPKEYLLQHPRALAVQEEEG